VPGGGVQIIVPNPFGDASQKRLIPAMVSARSPFDYNTDETEVQYMTTATLAKPLMTAEEFLALPNDGVERWLIRGELRENGDTDMTMRNKHHSMTESRISALLFMWAMSQPEPRCEIVSGEAGFRLRTTPATISAGVDVAVITAAQADIDSDDTTLIVGPPMLIAEVQSPSDHLEDIVERVKEYLDCGVPVVWLFNPYFKTVTVHRRGVDPLALGSKEILSGDPELPGFSAKVADFFR